MEPADSIFRTNSSFLPWRWGWIFYRKAGSSYQSKRRHTCRDSNGDVPSHHYERLEPHFSTLDIAVEDFLGKLVNIYQETRQKITEDANLHSHNSEEYIPQSSKVKTEAGYSSETLLNIFQNELRNISEENTSIVIQWEHKFSTLIYAAKYWHPNQTELGHIP